MKEITVLQRFNNRKNTIDCVDITTEKFKPENHMNVTYEAAMAEMHVIEKDGKVIFFNVYSQEL